MNVTYKIAMAAGQDAANRQMRANGRTEWNDEDYAVAVETTGHLLSFLTGAELIASRDEYHAVEA